MGIQASNQAIDARDWESAYGFSTVRWPTDGRPDGQYDLRLHSVCKPTPGVVDTPPGLDEAMSATITGRLDRTPPVQFGRAEPADQIFFPGADEISVSFLEQTRPVINCTHTTHSDSSWILSKVFKDCTKTKAN